MDLKENQVRGILLSTSHYTKEATDFTPKGTCMFHFALTEFATPKLKEAYEASKGRYYKEVEKGPHEGSPIHFTSQFAREIESGVLPEGGEIVFDFVKDRLQKTETLQERASKSSDRKAKDAISKVLSPETIAKMEMAKKLGLAVSV